MKKNRILLLCLVALISIVVLVSCFQEDPIKDNRIIGKWTAQLGKGYFTIEAKDDQTFVWTRKVDDETISFPGTWEASSVNEGVLKRQGVQFATFTAYGDEMICRDDVEGTITFRHPKQ